MRHDPPPLRLSLLHKCKNNIKMRERTTTLTTFACTKAIAIAQRERERTTRRENITKQTPIQNRMSELEKSLARNHIP
jgi:hypothetical protein